MDRNGGIELRVNFGKLKSTLRRPESKSRLGNTSSDCLSEFTATLSNYIEHIHTTTQEELALLTMSTQDWILRRGYTTTKHDVKMKDIFFADLGNNYKPEFSYPHPVVILEKVGYLYIVVPSSTSPGNIGQAHHPIYKPKGSKYMRLVYGDDTDHSDGFEKTGALLLSNLRTISAGRLLEKKGNISEDLYQEIKHKCFQLCFPKQFLNYSKLEEELKQTKEELLGLRNQVENDTK